jgi:hypothetical protein
MATSLKKFSIEKNPPEHKFLCLEKRICSGKRGCRVNLTLYSV